MKFGTLTFEPIESHRELVAGPVWHLASEQGLGAKVLVAPINAELSDTEAFCEEYGVGLDVSANCVVVQARRADRTWYAACIVLANNWIDVNKKVKKHLDARKLSFAPMDTAVGLTNMEFGGITPVGLPEDWPILIDEAVMNVERVVIGSGIRGSKILIETKTLETLPNVSVMDIQKH